jgi:hypothetical protein
LALGLKFGQIFEILNSNQKQELPLVAIFVGGMGQNEETL